MSMLVAIASVVLWISASQAIADQTVSPANGSLAVLRHEYAASRSAKNLHTKARHSYLLNDAADRYAFELDQATGKIDKYNNDAGDLMKNDTSPVVAKANRYGANLYWCDYGRGWTAAPTGYEAYLWLWPDGPDAEEAWWRGRLRHNLNVCFDAVGSEEETIGFVKDYTRFLRHFPRGRHKQEAETLLKGFKADLADYKLQQTH